MFSPGRVLAVGGALVALALVLVLTHSTYRVTGSNFTSRDAFVVVLEPGKRACQETEVWEHSGRVEMRIGTYDAPGPALEVSTSRARGSIAPGWTQGDVQIPLGPETGERYTDELCVTNKGPARIAIAGQPAPDFGAKIDGAFAGGKMRVDFYTGGKESLLSVAGRIADHFGIGKAKVLGGSWTLVPILLLLVGSWVLAIRAVLRPPARRRTVALLVGGVALCNGLAWGLLTPPMHVPDEVAHFAYAQHIAETGRLPVDQPGADLPPELGTIVSRLNFFAVVSDPHDKPIRSAAEERSLREGERLQLPRAGSGEALSATGNPPLYHLLQAAVYKLTPFSELLDKLAVMRMFTALLTALTAIVVVLFVRELFPGSPLLALGAGLVVAFQPLLGFMSGGVNNDPQLYLVAALLFYVLARAWRRGLDMRTAGVLAAVFVAGLLTKVTFVGLVPLAGLVLAAIAWRERRSLRVLALAAAPLAVAVLCYFVQWPLIDAWRTELSGTPDPLRAGERNRAEMLSYVWQLYLPRLPFMTDLLPEVPAYNLWFVGLVGRFGWLDYSFPGWVNQAALVPAALVAGLAVWALWRERRRVPWLLAAALGAGAVVFLLALGYVGYGYREDFGEPFEQARYLFPLLALYAGIVALALRGTGRRAHAALAAFVVVAIAHTLFSQLLTIDRYFA